MIKLSLNHRQYHWIPCIFSRNANPYTTTLITQRGKKIQRDEFSKTSARHLGIPWPSASAAPNPLFGRAAARELTARELVLAWEDTLTISRAADVCETLLAASLALNGQRPRSFSGFLLAPWLHGGLAGCFVCSDSSIC